MGIKTFKQMQDFVSRRMGLDLDSAYPNSNAVRDSVKDYLNLAQSELHKELLKIGEDYFLTGQILEHDSELPINQFSLPSHIYANKIRKVVYNYQRSKYVLRAISFDDFIEWSSPDLAADLNQPFGYYIHERTSGNTDPEGEERGLKTSTVIHFVPPSTVQFLGDEDSFEVFFLRVPRDMVADGDYPDIPESTGFLEAYANWQIALDDPTRNEDLYYRDHQNKLRNIIETFSDKDPQEGGVVMEIPRDVISNAINPVEDS